MPKLYIEEVPSFALRFSFQPNMAFMLAMFILMLALGWALRDHRRRLLELASEEQEDRFYLGILGSLFTVTTMGSYYAFNKTTVDTSGKLIVLNPLVSEILKMTRGFLYSLDHPYESWPPYTPEMGVHMPVPSPKKLDEHLSDGRHHDFVEDAKYNSLSMLMLMLVTMLAIFYFSPPKRPNISPPRAYREFKVPEASNAGDFNDPSTEERKQSEEAQEELL